jgi:hypothetical protein
MGSFDARALCGPRPDVQHLPQTDDDDQRRSQITARELTRAFRTSGLARTAAFQRVVMAMAVAEAVARRHSGRSVLDDELKQLAYLSLASVADRFDPTMEHDFLSFAVPWMSGTIRRHSMTGPGAFGPLARSRSGTKTCTAWKPAPSDPRPWTRQRRSYV